MTKNIAIVYHSGFGHTEKVAKYIEKGVKTVDGTTCHLLNVDSLKGEAMNQLNDMDAIVFGSPTYMGSVSAPMKQFMDDASNLWFQQAWKDKIAAGFTNSAGLSGDKFNTLMQLMTFACQHSMIWASLGIMNDSGSDNKPTGHIDGINRTGSYIGLTTQSDNKGVEETPSGGDLKTAELFGERLATITKSWK